MKSLIPKSKAKTAYGLLSEVRKLILEEPLRYKQTDWLCRISEGGWVSRGFPSCGTVGCVAGWVATLKDPGPFRPEDSGDIAAGVLGLDFDQWNELFGAHMVTGVPQTKRHAISGARHIAKFQKKYAAQLKAKRV